MIALSLEEVRALVVGALDGEGPITGVQIDSRRVRPGDLFVAVGRGTEYLVEARAAGAAATLVPDAAEDALAALGGAVRARSAATVVAITGSTGKTSTKDILAALCAPQRRTIAAEASFNNELGVPLTLCRLEPDTEVCILELGMRGFGQIAALCAFAKPDIGLITHVGPVHLELVGSVEGVARAKAEVVACLPPRGIAIAPLSPVLDAYLAREDMDVRRFDPAAVEPPAAEAVRRARHARRSLPFRAHAEHARRALRVRGPPGCRSRVHRGRGRDRVLALARRGASARGRRLRRQRRLQRQPDLDARRAPHLCERAAGLPPRRDPRRDGRAGARGPRYHREIGALPGELGIEVLVAIGPLARGYMDPGVETMRWLDRPEGFADLLRPGDAVLVKASRAAGLEGIAPALANEAVG